MRHQIEGDILGSDTLAECTVDGDPHRLGFLLEDTLRGHHHLHLRGTDTKGHSTQSPMCRGVGVATDDGHSR